MDKGKVLDLAKLARIELRNEEAESLSHEFEAILDYVGEVKKLHKVNKLQNFDKEDFPVKNVMRIDAQPHESGLYTKEILKQAPCREGDYIKVKKII